MFTVKKSDIHGRGVFATETIREGTHIGRYEGRRAKRDGRYVLWVTSAHGSLVGIKGTGPLRFVNHSNAPNAVFLSGELFALRTIEPGEEITFDYGEDWEDVGA